MNGNQTYFELIFPCAVGEPTCAACGEKSRTERTFVFLAFTGASVAIGMKPSSSQRFPDGLR
jgi:hypothetical protein